MLVVELGSDWRRLMFDKDKTKKAISTTIGVVVLAWYLYLALSHPDMTQARLLLAFWKQYLIGAVLCVAAVLIQVI